MHFVRQVHRLLFNWIKSSRSTISTVHDPIIKSTSSFLFVLKTCRKPRKQHPQHEKIDEKFPFPGFFRPPLHLPLHILTPLHSHVVSETTQLPIYSPTGCQGVSCRHPDRESTKPSFVAQNHSFFAFNFTNSKRYYMQYRSFWPPSALNPNYLIFIWNQFVFVKNLVKYRSHQFFSLTFLFTLLLILGESDTIVTVFERRIDWNIFISKW